MKFKVKIEEYETIAYNITTSVPQGAVLSATLFSIYINDIPTNIKKNKIYSLLFANDLVYFYIYKNNKKKASKDINNHLVSLTDWMKKWRLRLAPHKCNYLVFTNGTKNNSPDLDLILLKTKI